MSELEEHEVLEEQLEKNQEVEETFDFEGKSDIDLLDVLKKASSDELTVLGNKLQAVQDVFYARYNAKKTEALAKFIEEGGVKQDFELREDETVSSIKDLINAYSEQIKTTRRDQKEQVKTNFKRKETLLNELRELVQGDEGDETFKRIKEIQEEWKGIGEIPQNKRKDIYPNFRALMDMFYNNRSIYFDLKDLDRKKNQKLKEAVCLSAEALLQLSSAKVMMKELQELHLQYKNIGPVPREVQESLWERLKQASQKVYDFKDKVNAEFIDKLGANLVLKTALIEKLQPLTSFESTVINEWKAKTEELLQIQEEWKKIGPVPRADSKQVSKDFWKSGKTFFANKSAFFKTLDKKREEALAQKEELCQKTEDLASMEDVGEACHLAINIQKAWKKIGPAPRAVNDKIYQRFKTACDVLFNSRRAHQVEADKNLIVNLEAKSTLLTAIDEVFEAGISRELLEAYFEKWHNFGDVPAADHSRLNKQVQTALVAKIDASSVESKEVLHVIVEKELYKFDKNADRVFQKKIVAIRKKVSALEEDISTWGNNLMFFKKSANFEEMRKDFDDKIASAKLQIVGFKQQLRILQNN